MKIGRTRALAALVVLLAASLGAALFVVRLRQEPVPTASAQIDRFLQESGLPSDLAQVFRGMETHLESSSPRRVQVVQTLPAIGVRTEMRIVLLPDRSVDVSTLRATFTSGGTKVYPVHHSLRRVGGGYERYAAVFVPYDSLDPAALPKLGLPRRADARTTHPIALRTSSLSFVPGIIVATVTTTTGSGFENTAPQSAPPSFDRTAPQSAPPQAGEAVQPPPAAGEAPPLTPEQQAYLDAVNRELDAADNQVPTQPLSEADYASMRRTNEILQQQGRHPDAEIARRAQAWDEMQARRTPPARPQTGTTACGGTTAPSNVIPNLLQAIGAAEAVLEARRQFESNAADRAEGNELIDAYERAFRGETGNATADALARRALTEDPLGTQQTAERIAEARSDLGINTAVRGVNTAVGNGAAVATGPAAPIASAVIGLATAAVDAVLRDVHNAILSGLDRSSGELTQRARDVIRNAQTPDITNSRGPAPGEELSHRVDDGAMCESITGEPGAGQALIVVDVTEADGRRITFRSMVNLTNEIFLGFQYVSPDEYRGTSSGPYREIFVSDQCGFTITWTAPQMPVVVKAQLPDHYVSASIQGPATRNGEWPGTECLGGVYYSPNKDAPQVGTFCNWEGVDFTRPSITRGEAPYEGCTLNLGPLPTPTPRPR